MDEDELEMLLDKMGTELADEDARSRRSHRSNLRHKLHILNLKMKKTREQTEKPEELGRIEQNCRRRSARLTSRFSCMKLEELKNPSSECRRSERRRRVALVSTSESENDENPEIFEILSKSPPENAQFEESIYPHGYLAEMARLDEKEAVRLERKAIRQAHEREEEEKRRRAEERELAELVRGREAKRRRRREEESAKPSKNDSKRKKRDSAAIAAKVARLTDPSFDPSAISLFSIDSVPTAPPKPRTRRTRASQPTPPVESAPLSSPPSLPPSPEDLTPPEQLGSYEQLFENVDMTDVLNFNENTGVLETIFNGFEGFEIPPSSSSEEPVDSNSLEILDIPMLEDLEMYTDDYIDDSFLQLMNDDQLMLDPVDAFNHFFPIPARRSI